MTIDFKAQMAEMDNPPALNPGCKECNSFMYTPYFKELHPYVNIPETWSVANTGLDICPEVESWVWITVYNNKSTQLTFHVPEYKLLERVAEFYDLAVVDPMGILEQAVFSDTPPEYFIHQAVSADDLEQKVKKLCTASIIFTPETIAARLDLSLGPLRTAPMSEL
jgi:hypothetical protein